jgi:LacI family transcriptional regulator
VLPGRKWVGLAFVPALRYSREITESLFQEGAAAGWSILEFPRHDIGLSPIRADARPLDAVVTWAEPRDQWVLDLVAQGTRVINCGLEWVGTGGIASTHFDHHELQQAVLAHFKALHMTSVVAMGHALEHRPASRRTYEQFATLARHEGMNAQVWNLQGEGSPAHSPERLLRADEEKELAAFLTGLPKPTGILCASDHMAVIVSQVAARLGIRVPEDLAVVGHGDSPLAATSDPSLTSVAGDAQALGHAAGRLLAAWFDSGEIPENPVIIPGCRLSIRESTTGRSRDAALEVVRHLIEKEGPTGLSIGELVAACQLSPKTLVRRYREAFGIEPSDHIHQLRIERAKQLLTKGPGRIAEVAAACGFSSQAAFTNYFRRHAACSPGEFSRQRRPAPSSGQAGPST